MNRYACRVCEKLPRDRFTNSMSDESKSGWGERISGERRQEAFIPRRARFTAGFRVEMPTEYRRGRADYLLPRAGTLDSSAKNTLESTMPTPIPFG